MHCRMSALGQKQTYAVHKPMSAKCHKQTCAVSPGDVCFTPKADVPSAPPGLIEAWTKGNLKLG